MRRRLVYTALAVLLCVLALGAPAPARAQEGPDGPMAKSVILFLGDGMGVSTVTAARLLAGGAEAELTLDRMPYTALSRTYSASHIVTDSAAGMNALVCGHKTQNGVIAMDERTERNDANGDGDGAPLPTLLELAEAAGKSTGIVTTTRVTHATPAACYAHVNERNKEAAIALQLVPGWPEYNRALGDGIDVILGGGRRYFVPKDDKDGNPVLDEEGAPGARTDGRDLRAEMQNAGYTYVWNADQLAGIELLETDKLLGLFESSHMKFDAERRMTDPPDEPSLAEMTAAALTMLRRNPQGYFLMVEGGRIDHAHHGNSAYGALTETLAFDAAIKRAAEIVDPNETLIIVTADHSHVMTIAGDPKRGTSILGIGGTDRDGVPYTILGYTNGPGYRERVPAPVAGDSTEAAELDANEAEPDEGRQPKLVRPDPGDSTAPRYIMEAGIPMESETHGGEDVVVWATGAGAEQVRGVVENTQVFTWMRRALGI